MNRVKLSVAPLLSLTWSNSVLLQQPNDLGFHFQLFRIQTFPDPLTVNDRITVSSTVSSVNGLAVIETLVVVAMAFRARLQRRIHRAKIATSMFGVAGGAGNSSVAMGRNETRSEAFGVIASVADGVPLLFIRHIHPE